MPVILPSKENGFFFFSGDGENPSNESGAGVKQSSLKQSISPGP